MPGEDPGNKEFIMPSAEPTTEPSTAGDAAAAESEPFPVVGAALGGATIAAGVGLAHIVYADAYVADLLFFSSFLAFLGYVALLMAFKLSEEVGFTGLQLGVISIGMGESRFGQFFLVMYLPFTGLGPFFRTIYRSPMLGIPWTLVVTALLFCATIALRAWLAKIGA